MHEYFTLSQAYDRRADRPEKRIKTLCSLVKPLKSSSISGCHLDIEDISSSTPKGHANAHQFPTCERKEIKQHFNILYNLDNRKKYLKSGSCQKWAHAAKPRFLTSSSFLLASSEMNCASFSSSSRLVILEPSVAPLVSRTLRPLKVHSWFNEKGQITLNGSKKASCSGDHWISKFLTFHLHQAMLELIKIFEVEIHL